jgi:hypothetical protein
MYSLSNFHRIRKFDLTRCSRSCQIQICLIRTRPKCARRQRQTSMGLIPHRTVQAHRPEARPHVYVLTPPCCPFLLYLRNPAALLLPFLGNKIGSKRVVDCDEPTNGTLLSSWYKAGQAYLHHPQKQHFLHRKMIQIEFRPYLIYSRQNNSAHQKDKGDSNPKNFVAPARQRELILSEPGSTPSPALVAHTRWRPRNGIPEKLTTRSRERRRPARPKPRSRRAASANPPPHARPLAAAATPPPRNRRDDAPTRPHRKNLGTGRISLYSTRRPPVARIRTPQPPPPPFHAHGAAAADMTLASLARALGRSARSSRPRQASLPPFAPSLSPGRPPLSSSPGVPVWGGPEL